MKKKGKEENRKRERRGDSHGMIGRGESDAKRSVDVASPFFPLRLEREDARRADENPDFVRFRYRTPRRSL